MLYPEKGRERKTTWAIISTMDKNTPFGKTAIDQGVIPNPAAESISNHQGTSGKSSKLTE